jgi:hypothetical protein
MNKFLLAIPANDAEAVMILRLAKAFGLPVIISSQPHGASLDKEPQIIEKIKKSGAKKIVIVEMPGLKTEKQLAALGFRIKIIDHHNYLGLNRKKKLSSLEQFLKMFKISDQKIKVLGFVPRLVRGIGIFDRGFIWALQKEGYSKTEVKKVLLFRQKLMRPFVDSVEEKKYKRAARAVWQQREKWQDFFIVRDNTKKGLRPYLSLLVALEIGRPTPLIVVEHGRNIIYVQETNLAKKLFKKFGGFTFGEKGNWGYKNEPGKPMMTLAILKKFLEN